jgi:hypothetical protein
MQIESEKRDSAPQNLATPKVNTLREENMAQRVTTPYFRDSHEPFDTREAAASSIARDPEARTQVTDSG